MSAADVIGRLTSEVLPTERAREVLSRHQQVIETDQSFSATFRIGNEGRWWFSTYFPIADAGGNVMAVGAVAVDVTEQKLQEEKLNYLAYYDALTGLPNRALLHEQLTRQLRSDIGDQQTALIVLNINRFGVINESLGRRAGDALLQEVANRLKTVWPIRANVARLNADCFAGMLTGFEHEASLIVSSEALAEKIFGKPFIIEGQELIVSMTAGIAVASAGSADPDRLLQNAEAAMRQAKISSVRCLFYQPAMNATVAEMLMLENRLRRALDDEEFVLHYQPKINLSDGKMIGLEALIRWNNPESGLVPPMKFIPLLEETGLIVEVGKWALRRALTDFRAWSDAGLTLPRIAVNVSAIQLAQENFVDVVRGLINEFGADSHGLDLEITESLLMKDIEANIVKLRAIREMGIEISIDDFGTGYSSLGYLAKLPIDALKIDRSFVITMVDEADGMAIASTIISLARSLDLKVIAEGVETEERSRLLRLLKCDVAQGYFFHRPLPAQAITDLLRA